MAVKLLNLQNNTSNNTNLCKKMRMAIEHELKNMTLRQLWELFPIVLTPHQSQWMIWADEECESLYRLLSVISPLTITHIGSTAIELSLIHI